MKAYLAARYSRRLELCEHRDLLRALGWEVTGRWLDGGHEVAKEQEHATAERSRFAREDRDDLMRADVVIAFTEPARSTPSRGARHTEFGIALASGKRCIVIGPRENVFHCLPEVEVYPAWTDFLQVYFPPRTGAQGPNEHHHAPLSEV